MQSRRRIFVSLVVTVPLLLLVGAGIVLAQGPDGNEPSSTQAALGTGFTYQGRLTNSGSPVDATCDFRFSLWDAGGTSGNQIGSDHTVSNVQVSDGRFTAQVNTGGEFGSSAFAGDARWLEVEVNCPNDSSFQRIGRQQLQPAPYAQHAASGPFWRLTGNAGTNSSTNFLGTTDEMTLTLAVSNTTALRIAPASDNSNSSPNVIGGHPNNKVVNNEDDDPPIVGATIGGGGINAQYGNTIGGDFATIGGGFSNEAVGEATVSGGVANRAGGTNATVSGGANNQAGTFATVGGGEGNTASGSGATIGGGDDNTASYLETTVGGGQGNTATGRTATVGGGANNLAQGDYATIAGGSNNEALGHAATVSGGGTTYEISPGFVCTANTATGKFSTVAGGTCNEALNDQSTVSGGVLNVASDFRATVSGGGWNEAGGRLTTIGGGQNNTASGAGATVGGGYRNTADGQAVIVAGGRDNIAVGQQVTIGGGGDNVITGTTTSLYATIGGGSNNVITDSASYATIPGGRDNRATGAYSFAAGRGARADADGSFVWADSNNQTVRSTQANEFKVMATGGAIIYTKSDFSTGVNLVPGGSSWGSISDRRRKTDFRPVDSKAIAAAVAEMPISTWRYKGKGNAVRHMGPTAQDFNAAFDVGREDMLLSTQELDGVALAAIQGVYELVQEQDAEIATLKKENAQLTQRIDDLETRVANLEQMVAEDVTHERGARSGLPLPTPGWLVAGLLLGYVLWRREG